MGSGVRTGVWYSSRHAIRDHTSIALSDPCTTKGIYRTPLVMVPPLPSGHAWVRAVRARGRDNGPPGSHGMQIHIGCTSIPRCAHTPFHSWRDWSLSVLPLGILLGLIVVAYRSKHADDVTSEVSSIMNLTNSLRSVPVWVLAFDQSHTALAWGATMKS